MSANMNDEEIVSRTKGEKRLFWFLTLFLAPLMSIAIVGGLGFAIWIFQMIAGPPGPPAGLG